MLSSNNLLSPANGQPVTSPTQDIVLGICYLTSELPVDDSPLKFFDDDADVMKAVDYKQIRIMNRIKFLINNEYIETTAGRIIFNRILTEGMSYLNVNITDKDLSQLISNIFRK